MPTRADLASAALALAAHAAMGYALLRAPLRPPGRPSLVEVEIRTPAPAPEVSGPAPPEPPHPRAPPTRALPSISPPPSHAPPQRAEAKPSPPVFGFTMESTTEGESSMSVPIGNTVAVDPNRSAPHGGPVAPLPATRGGQTDGDPGALAIRTMPDIDAEACGRTISYPKEAEALGIQGSVRLRVSLDEKGKVVEVKVLSGLGHGLDRVAVDAIEHKCKFTPAIANDGRPVPYVIDPYVFHFEIPR